MGERKDEPPHPVVLKKFRERFDEKSLLFPLMDELASEVESFKRAETCLSIGTGYGEYDIEFIKRCLPSLKKLIVIEKEQHCIKELKVNLYNAFGDKFETEMYESTVEDFMKEPKRIEAKVDVLLILHALYTMEPSVGLELFKTCFSTWLKPNNGMLVYLGCSTENCLSKISTILGVQKNMTFDGIKESLPIFGGSIVSEKTYAPQFDFQSYDKDLYELFKYNKNIKVDETYLWDVIKIVAPNGFGDYVCNFCVMKSKTDDIQVKKLT